MPLDTPATVSAGAGDDASAAPATIIDASTTGARIGLDATQAWRLTGGRTPEPGDTVRIAPTFRDAAHLQRPILCRVRSVAQNPGGAILGVAFEPGQSVKMRETIAYLVFGESSKWLRMRRDATARKGLLAGLGYVAWLAISTLPSTLLFVLTRRTETAAPPLGASEDRDASLRAFGADIDLFEVDRDAERARANPAAHGAVAEAAN